MPLHLRKRVRRAIRKLVHPDKHEEDNFVISKVESPSANSWEVCFVCQELVPSVELNQHVNTCLEKQERVEEKKEENKEEKKEENPIEKPVENAKKKAGVSFKHVDAPKHDYVQPEDSGEDQPAIFTLSAKKLP